MKIKKVLIPNRGEIAVRIIKAAHALGIQTVVTLSELEKDTLPAQLSNEVHLFEDGPFSENYLNIPLIISLAKTYEADAIHPGYGFLSENEELAKACEEHGIRFVGPSAENLKLMGDKQSACEIARQSNVPLTPSWEGTQESIIARTGEMTFPVLVKAAMGGGGKGMLICNNATTLKKELPNVAAQAKRYFGDDRVYVERYIAQPRHIEVQVLADSYGNTVHLFERECSVQRRFQKIIEEAPAPDFTDQQRIDITTDAVRLCRSIGYKSAGTLEFLVDQEGHHYFLEMNTRIQVEHCVTEEITGIDLVQWQFRIANGEALTVNQADLSIQGHAIEARVYAERPEDDFKPSPGSIKHLHWPTSGLVRKEVAYNTPVVVHSQFDPMIAKLIVHRSRRKDAIKALKTALMQTYIHGVHTNVRYLCKLLSHNKFEEGKLHTHFCADHHNELTKTDSSTTPTALVAYALKRLLHNKGIEGYWRMMQHITFKCDSKDFTAVLKKQSKGWLLQINDQSYNITAFDVDKHLIHYTVDGSKQTAAIFDDREKFTVVIEQEQVEILAGDILPEYIPDNQNDKASHGTILKAPLPGVIMKLMVKEGQEVKKGTTLMVLEAMKMENHLTAWKDCKIEKIHIKNGASVTLNQTLLTTN